MGKFIKSIVAGILTLSMTTWGAPVWGAVLDSESISITVSIAGTGDISVEYLDSDTGVSTSGPLTFSVTASNLNVADPSTCWAVANQCVRVSFSSTYAWGLRIISDARQTLIDEGIFTTDLDGDGDVDVDDVDAGGGVGAYIPPAMAELDGDGLYDEELFSGLLYIPHLDSGVSDEDPSMRAPLAWQAYDEWSTTYLSYSPQSRLEDHTGDTDGEQYIDETTVGNVWSPDYDDWNYIGDKNDDGYAGDLISQDSDGDGIEEFAYPIVAAGFPGTYGSLVPATGGNVDGSMPDIEDDDGDGYGDLVIFIATRLANTNWSDKDGDGDVDPVPFVLTGDYTTSLAVELIYE